MPVAERSTLGFAVGRIEPLAFVKELVTVVQIGLVWGVVSVVLLLEG